MPRAPNRKIQKASELYQKGFHLQEIAERLNLPDGTVRRWKSVYNWHRSNPDGQSNFKVKNRCIRGAPPGNHNAAGNKGGRGGPERNTFAEKHGAYSKIYYDMLDDTDWELMELVELDEETILTFQLCDLLIAARRLNHCIKALDDEHSGLLLNGTVEERLPKGNRTAEIMTSTFDLMIALESVLDKIQGRITKVTDTLIKYREEREQLDIERERLLLIKYKALGIIDSDSIDLGDDESDDGHGGG